MQVGEQEEVVSIDRLKPHRGAVPVQPALPPAITVRGRCPLGLIPFLILVPGPRLVRGIIAEQIDEKVMRKIPQIVWAAFTSFIVPVYSLVYCQPPYKIHLL